MWGLKFKLQYCPKKREKEGKRVDKTIIINGCPNRLSVYDELFNKYLPRIDTQSSIESGNYATKCNGEKSASGLW
jgi:hypothetical protein